MKKLFATLGIAALAAAAAILPAGAQSYPTKPIRLICPFPAGAGADISARIMAEALSQRLGQQVVVENRAGVGGATGIEYVAKSTPDGYTLGWPSADPMVMLPAFKKTMPYKVPEDFIFIGKFVETGLTITVSANLNINTAQEFAAHVKANSGKIKSGTSGVAGASDIVSYLIEKSAGGKLNHVHYKGIAPALTDLLGGHVDAVFATPSSAAPQQSTGKIKILAVTSPKRHPLLPNVPTVVEAGMPGVLFTSWYGMVAPAGTPAPIVERLRKEVAWIISQPEYQARAEKAALQPAPMVGDEFKNATMKEIAAFKALAESEKIVVQDD
jgi:tripartite-type tricarboxylate transporter receptor subunit TctC